MKLDSLIKKNKKFFSVIMTFYVILEKYKDTLKDKIEFDGLTSAEIRKKYNKLAAEYGKKDFAASYVQRHSKTGDFFIESDGNYKIRPELITDINELTATRILSEIKIYFDSFNKRRKEVVQKLYDIKDIHEFEKLKNEISSLMDLELFNKGQLFEIISFSILQSYFDMFGFSLKRFSTTFSNDGGMDFIANNCIYQVTNSPSEKKILSDLDKLPNIKRVLVIPKINKQIENILNSDELVLSFIIKEDLLNHFLPIVVKQGLKEKLIKTIIIEISREI